MAVLSSQYGVKVPQDCYSLKGKENHFVGRDRISQSRRAAVRVTNVHIVNHNCSRSVEVFRQSWFLYWGRSDNYCSTLFVM